MFASRSNSRSISARFAATARRRNGSSESARSKAAPSEAGSPTGASSAFSPSLNQTRLAAMSVTTGKQPAAIASKCESGSPSVIVVEQ